MTRMQMRRPNHPGRGGPARRALVPLGTCAAFIAWLLLLTFMTRAAASPQEPPDATGAGVAYEQPVPGEVLTGFSAPDAPWGAGHRGVDLAAGGGQDVRVAGAGVVAFVGRVVDRTVVSIDHADGIRTTYEPVEPSISTGDHVSAGEVIGTVAQADSGPHCAPASCLHWGARTGPDAYIDPMSLLAQDPVIRLYPAAGRL